MTCIGASKATESYGAALDRRIHHEHELDHLRVPAHIARLARACWTLGGEPALTGLRLRQWAFCPPRGGASGR